jgi:hypothetical protein
MDTALANPTTPASDIITITAFNLFLMFFSFEYVQNPSIPFFEWREFYPLYGLFQDFFIFLKNFYYRTLFLVAVRIYNDYEEFRPAVRDNRQETKIFKKGRNMKSARVLLLSIVMITLCCASGCLSRVIKEGMGTATGAKGGFQELDWPGQLSDCNFVVGKLESANQKIIPVQLMNELPAELAKQMKESNIPTSGQPGKTVVINVKVIYYEKAGAFGQLFGPLEEVIAEVTLVDKANGRILGQAMCVGRSQESVNKGIPEKTQGLAKGICKWIEKVGNIQRKDNDKE